ncbi:MAG: hypothetical protein K2V38_14355 [Gemmataceae bacterium]|nr:hypothetical protein [Gemmataceae bacterium]
MNWIRFTLAAAALVGAVAPGRAQEPGKQGLREVTLALGESVRKTAAKLEQSSVRIGFFTPFGIDHGNAGGAFMAELALALQGFVNKDAVLELYGSYGFVENPEGSGVKVIVVEAKLKRTTTGRDEKEFAPFEGYIRANTDINRMIGGIVSHKPDDKYKDPFKDRNKEIQDGLPYKPPAGPGKPPEKVQPPKVQAHIDGTLVKARKESEYAVEIRKKALDDKGNAKAVGAELKDGLPFVPIDKGEVYEVRVINNSNHEIAVSLAIDGIDQFTFSEDRTDLLDASGKQVLGADGKCIQRPKFGHWIVEPCKGDKPGEVLITGWHKTADPKRKDNVMSFLVTEYGKGAASKFPTQAQGKVGLITVGIARSFPKGTSRSGGETGFGPDRELKQEVVQRTIDPPHEFVTIRYNR